MQLIDIILSLAFGGIILDECEIVNKCQINVATVRLLAHIYSITWANIVCESNKIMYISGGTVRKTSINVFFPSGA